jgi:Na+-driven multidrug efflux pump
MIINISSEWFAYGFFSSLMTRGIIRNELADNNLVIIGLFTPIFIIIYLLPSILALYKNTKYKNYILIINFVSPLFYIFVLTFMFSDEVFAFMTRIFIISWFATLIATLTDKKLNEDDKILSNEKSNTNLTLIKKIEELNKLKEKEILTEKEFSKLKEKLIDDE